MNLLSYLRMITQLYDNHQYQHPPFPARHHCQLIYKFFKTNSSQPTQFRRPLKGSPCSTWEAFVFQSCSLPVPIATTWQSLNKHLFFSEFLKARTSIVTSLHSATFSSKETWIYLKTLPIWTSGFLRFLCLLSAWF